MPAHAPATDGTLAEAVASMGSALLKTLPSRRWVHDRSVAVWGDLESFESAPLGQAAPRADDFAEMTV